MFSVLLLVGFVVSACSAAADVWQYAPMLAENATSKDNNGMLGICFGTETTWAQYPYAAALRYSTGGACCSGTIISTNPGVILTAAHCNGCTGTVRIGCNNPAQCDGDQYQIAQFIQNPGYGAPTQFSNDIAIVRLVTGITTQGALAAGVPSVETSLGTVQVTGYGITESGAIPTSLQTMQSTIIERQECQDIMSSALGGGTYIDATMICIRNGAAGSDNQPTMCSGDSGGPMVANGQVYAANSWVLQGSGAGCNTCSCCSGYPQVGASAASASEWINGYLGEWTQKYGVSQSESQSESV